MIKFSLKYENCIKAKDSNDLLPVIPSDLYYLEHEKQESFNKLKYCVTKWWNKEQYHYASIPYNARKLKGKQLYNKFRLHYASLPLIKDKDPRTRQWFIQIITRLRKPDTKVTKRKVITTDINPARLQMINDTQQKNKKVKMNKKKKKKKDLLNKIYLFLK